MTSKKGTGSVFDNVVRKSSVGRDSVLENSFKAVAQGAL